MKHTGKCNTDLIVRVVQEDPGCCYYTDMRGEDDVVTDGSSSGQGGRILVFKGGVLLASVNLDRAIEALSSLSQPDQTTKAEG